MKLPYLKTVQTAMDGATGFTGYDRELKAAETSFFDEKNITGEFLPVIRSRNPRGKVRTFTKANGLYSHDGKLVWVDGTGLYYDGALVGTVSDSEKTFFSMGAQVIIWPDKLLYNARTGVLKSLEASYTSTGAVTAVLSKADGTPYGAYTVSSEAPSDPKSGDLWLDTAKDPVVLKQYAKSMGMWTSIATVYVKISAQGIGKDFSEYDGVTISGMDDDELNGKFFVVSRGDDWIVVIAIIRQAVTNVGAMTMTRTVPDMEYMTENNNRLWGCNSEHNEIYACVLGDPTNWNRYMGLSTDSYAMTVGSGGTFTGAISHLGNVLFFKEDMIHQILGTMPSNFTLSDTRVRGVEKGSAKSLCVLNEVLYYKSLHDVCAYGQGLPSGISEPLGEEHYSNAVAGARGQELFICMEQANGEHVLFTYDPKAGAWSKEDGTSVRWFASAGAYLYFVEGNILYNTAWKKDDPYADSTAKQEAPVEWMLETGDLGLDAPYNKYIGGIQLFAEADIGTTLRVEALYDHSGAWEEMYRFAATSRRSVTLPFVTRRCRTLKIRISGKGAFTLWSILKRVEQGSDRYAAW